MLDPVSLSYGIAIGVVIQFSLSYFIDFISYLINKFKRRFYDK